MPPFRAISIVHAVLQRVRIKVTALYHSETLKLALEDSLTDAPGITRVPASTITSTLLVIYEAGVKQTRIVHEVIA